MTSSTRSFFIPVTPNIDRRRQSDDGRILATLVSLKKLSNVSFEIHISSKGSVVYDKHFTDFAEWMQSHDLDVKKTTSENLSAYLQDLSEWKVRPSILWSRRTRYLARYCTVNNWAFELRLSAIKKTLLTKYSIQPDLSLPTSLLKQNKKKSHLLSRPGVCRFADQDYITHKLAALVMIHGGVRRDEATWLLWGDVTRYHSHLVIKITESKTDAFRKGFTFYCMANDDKTLCRTALYDAYKA